MSALDIALDDDELNSFSVCVILFTCINLSNKSYHWRLMYKGLITANCVIDSTYGGLIGVLWYCLLFKFYKSVCPQFSESFSFCVLYSFIWFLVQSWDDIRLTGYIHLLCFDGNSFSRCVSPWNSQLKSKTLISEWLEPVWLMTSWKRRELFNFNLRCLIKFCFGPVIWNNFASPLKIHTRCNWIQNNKIIF